LAQALRSQRHPHTLMAVVMDAAPGERDAELLRHPPYRVVDRLWALDGPADAARYAVNPDWRGVTPYVALMQPGQPTRWVTGPPSAAALSAWLQTAPKPKASRRH
jgi:hypothetical protein